jgi:hypothetical protein
MTEQQWRCYGQLAVDHLENIKAILDVEEPSYRRLEPELPRPRIL